MDGCDHPKMPGKIAFSPFLLMLFIYLRPFLFNFMLSRQIFLQLPPPPPPIPIACETGQTAIYQYHGDYKPVLSIMSKLILQMYAAAMK